MIPKFHTLVAAFDGTEASEEAFAAMMPLIRQDQPEVAVLYVYPAPAMSYFPPPRLAEACARLRGDGVNAHLTIREGNPVEEILKYLKQRRPDLLVMETEGRSGLRRLARRSVAEEVLHQTDVPVLLVRPGAARNAWSRMLVALDGSSRAEEILQDVVPLAERLQAAVELVRVALPPVTGLGLGDARARRRARGDPSRGSDALSSGGAGTPPRGGPRGPDRGSDGPRGRGDPRTGQGHRRVADLPHDARTHGVRTGAPGQHGRGGRPPGVVPGVAASQRPDRRNSAESHSRRNPKGLSSCRRPRAGNSARGRNSRAFRAPLASFRIPLPLAWTLLYPEDEEEKDAMLDLDKLSPHELAMISHQTAEECEFRLRRIAAASDPADHALQHLLRAMAKETWLQIQSHWEDPARRPFGSSTRLSSEGLREFIRAALPSLTRRFGEGTLHRDNALFYAESLEEEAARFYRRLAEHAREAELRSLFTELSDRERGKMRFLRDVVLQG
jgi:nucleotide-binding universal stress UspA family protein